METKKTKILIATGIYPPDIGGPATMLQYIAKSLSENGFEIKVLTYTNSTPKGDDNIIRVPKKGSRFFSSLSYFLKMLKMSRWADVVYVTDIYSVGYFAYLIKKITGKKYIVRFAGDSAWEIATSNGWTNDYIVDFQKNNYGSRIEALKKRRKKILVGADKVIAVSNFLANVAEMIGVKKEKISVIYNSVDFVDIGGGKIKEIKNKFGQGSKIIVTACRLMPWKGVDGIIKVLPKLIKKIGNINFLVLGDGQELENLKKLTSEIRMTDNVYFLGRISRDDIMDYFGVADLFVLNTNYEGLSHTILEAMKAGTPVVATNVGGNPEVIEDGKDGLLVDYNNEEELLEAMSKVLSDEVLADTISKNAKEKLKKFDWNETVGKTVMVIKETINK